MQASKKQAKKHEKSLEELLNDFVENPVHKLEVGGREAGRVEGGGERKEGCLKVEG